MYLLQNKGNESISLYDSFPQLTAIQKMKLFSTNGFNGFMAFCRVLPILTN